jgi:hypothetical protein
MTVRTQLAYVAAALTILLGTVALLNPMLVARLLGLEVVTPRGLAEIRSGYGGLTLALGASMLWALPLRPKRGALLRILALLIASAVAGRLISIAVDGVLGLGSLVFLVLQAFVAVAAFGAGSELPPTPGELRARREAAEARDEAASARVDAVVARRRQVPPGQAPSADVESHRP